MASIRDFSVYCIPNNTLTQQVMDICSGISMATSIVGFVGAALQLKSLWQYHNRQRRRPSANPRIIFYLALSDLLSCIGIFGLAVVAFIQPPNTDVQDKHIHAYVVIAFLVEKLTIFAFLASYIWTFTYALDMCLQIYRIECPIIVYHILSWLVPWCIVLSVAVVGNIDRGHYTCEDHDGRTTRLILSYIVVMVVICGNPFLFVVTYKKIKHFLRTSGSFTDDDRKALNLFKRKFFWIVFVFTLCWVPNIISVSCELAAMVPALSKHNNSYLGTKTFHVFLGVEAFFNPLQGVFNFFVYRNAFRVTANETRTNLSPSVPRAYSVLARSNRDVVQRIHQDCVPHSTQDFHNVPQESSQNIADLSIAYVGESPRVGSHLSTRRADASPNTYVCKLLGE